jgi:hypothetical protein
MKANQFWWHEQNKMGKYQKGGHVKIEVEDKELGFDEWLWLLVDHCDDE